MQQSLQLAYIRAHHSNSFYALPLLCALTQVAMIAALCTPPAPVLILSWSVVVVVVGVGCCCCIPFRLALMLVLTFPLAATYSGGVSPLDVGTKSPLAPTEVPPIATCADGVFSSTHWRRCQTCTRATCTVVVVVVVDVCVCGSGGCT